MTWVVQIIEIATGKIEREIPCGTARRAERVRAGARINLNHSRFRVAAKEKGAGSDTASGVQAPVGAADWQVVTICPGFKVEVNCNGGGYRRVYEDGRIEVQP